MGRNRGLKTEYFYWGDCSKVLESEFPNESIHMIFADPPYNLSGKNLVWKEKKYTKVNEKWDTMSSQEYWDFSRSWISQSYRVLASGGSIYICCTYHNLGEILVVVKEVGLEVRNLITWYKPNAMPNMSRRVFTHGTEFLVWATKGKGWTFHYDLLKELNPEKQKNGKKKAMRDLWVLPTTPKKERIKKKDGSTLHSTQKPLAIVERAILASSNPGEIILDPFMGTGTTAIAAHKHGRKWVGIEENKEYLDYAQKRWEDYLRKHT